MKVLVTGGAGFIGSYIVDALEDGMRELVAWGKIQDAEDRSDVAYEELKEKGLGGDVKEDDEVLVTGRIY